MTFKQYILKFKKDTGCTSAQIASIISQKMAKRTPESWITKTPAEPDEWTQTSIKEKLEAFKATRAEALKKLSPDERKTLCV